MPKLTSLNFNSPANFPVEPTPDGITNLFDCCLKNSASCVVAFLSISLEGSTKNMSVTGILLPSRLKLSTSRLVKKASSGENFVVSPILKLPNILSCCGAGVKSKPSRCALVCA